MGFWRAAFGPGCMYLHPELVEGSRPSGRCGLSAAIPSAFETCQVLGEIVDRLDKSSGLKISGKSARFFNARFTKNGT